MPKYEIVISELSGSQIIKRINEDGSESWIPQDEGNSDYQAYLASSNEAATL
jgi:hypothetical protein